MPGLGVDMKVGVLHKNTFIPLADNFKLFIPRGTPVSVNKSILFIHFEYLPLKIFKTNRNFVISTSDNVPIARIPVSAFNPHPPYPLSLLC